MYKVKVIRIKFTTVSKISKHKSNVNFSFSSYTLQYIYIYIYDLTLTGKPTKLTATTANLKPVSITPLGLRCVFVNLQ